MKQAFQAKKLTKLGVAVSLALAANGAGAAQHPLTKNTYLSGSNVNVLDMVVSIDWDFDTPPAGRDKAYIEAVLRQAAQSYYTMTEGKHLLGKMYVYKNSQFMDNTDNIFLLENGRASAHAAGFMEGKSYRNRCFAGTGESAENVGKTFAHEFGHYVLGLSDEYREEGKMTAPSPGSPLDGDTPKNSIMHDHTKWSTLSTATDYADPATQKTAQFRVYGKSAWETLTSPPVNVPGVGFRIDFASFKNMTAPTAADLKMPTTGWEGEFKVVYMGAADGGTGTTAGFAAAPTGPINVIVVDTTTSQAQLSAQLVAADQVVNAAGSNVRIAVLAHPYGSAPVVPLTSLSQSNARATIKAAISKIALSTASDDTTVGDRLFDWAESTLPGYFPAGVKSTTGLGYYYRLYAGTNKGVGVKDGRVFYYDGKTVADIGPVSQYLPQSRRTLSDTLQKGLDIINAVRSDADTPTVTLFTTDTQTVSKKVAQGFANAKVSVNPVVLAVSKGTVAGRGRFSAADSDSQSLFDLAKGTSGQFQEGAKLADLGRNAVKATHGADGDNYEVITDSQADTLAAGASSSVVSVISGNDIDGEVTFEAFWSSDDDGKISFALTAPNGTKITPSTLPTGITYSAEAGEESASYTVSTTYAGRAGKWTSTVTASAAMVDSVSQEVAVKSKLSAGVSFNGGTTANPSAMTAVALPGFHTVVEG